MQIKNKIFYVFFVLILLTGYIFRIYNLEKNAEFNWDQERTAEVIYEMVKNKKPVLIGPRVGPAKFFLPPVYYYLALPFLWATGFNPIGLYYLSALLSFLTALVLYFTAEKLFNRQTAFVALAFYLFSPFIVIFNRIPWNVNLLFISSLLTLYSQYKIFIKKSKNIFNYILLGVGIGLGFQAHFTAIFLPIISLLLILIKKNFSKKYLITILVVLFFLLPIIVFELRHDFLNTRQLAEFIFFNSKTNAELGLWERLFRNFKIALELGGKIFLLDSFKMRTKIFFGGLMVFYLLKEAYFPENKRKKLYRLIFLYFMLTVFILAFYKGEVPEYYFFIFAPLFIILFADFLVNVLQIFKRFYFLVAVLFLFAVLLKASFLKISTVNNEALYFKQKAVDYIIALSSNEHFKINYIMETGRNVGFDYLFKVKNGQLDAQAEKEFIIVHPFIPEYNRELFVYYPDFPGENIDEYKQFGAYAVKKPEKEK